MTQGTYNNKTSFYKDEIEGGKRKYTDRWLQRKDNRLIFQQFPEFTSIIL
jgi:hypothetical protein